MASEYAETAAQQARLDAIAARKAELAADEHRYARKTLAGVNPLTVKCPWCSANIGARCTVPGTQIMLKQVPPLRTGFHPSRIEAAMKAQATA